MHSDRVMMISNNQKLKTILPENYRDFIHKTLVYSRQIRSRQKQVSISTFSTFKLHFLLIYKNKNIILHGDNRVQKH